MHLSSVTDKLKNIKLFKFESNKTATSTDTVKPVKAPKPVKYKEKKTPITAKVKNATSPFKKLPSPVKDPFSIRMALCISVILTACLWWLPIFGQMIAGYVGGRKSGSALNGVLVAGAAVGMFIVTTYVLLFFGIDMIAMQMSFMESVLGDIPGLAEFMSSVFVYAQSMFDAFGTMGSSLALIAAVTMIFGLIGGLMAGQVRSEMIYGRPGESRPSPRSPDVQKASKKPMSFGSFEDYQPMSATGASAVPEKPVVTTTTAKAVPKTAVQAEPVQGERSPFSSVLDMSDRTATPREILTKPAAVASAAVSASGDDYEYI